MPPSPHEIAIVEEKLAWCIAVHAPADLIDRLRVALADGQVELVEKSADAMLPRAPNVRAPEPSRPVRDGDDIRFDNGLVQATVNAHGALLELGSPRTRVPLAQANLLGAFRDFPNGWRLRVRPSGIDVHEDGVEIRFVAGSSPLTMAIEVRRGEPFVRVACATDWRAHATLALENWVALRAPALHYGIDRRYLALSDERAGVALFVLDPADWKSSALRAGGTYFRASLLRDRGAAQLAWAFAPFEPGISNGRLEGAYEAFAYPPRVRLFTSEDPAVIVTGTKPAQDGDGVIVHAREVDGADRTLRLRCGARMREVDAGASIEGEAIVAGINGLGEQSFRVRF